MKKKIILGASFLCAAIIAIAATHMSSVGVNNVNDTIPAKASQDKVQSAMGEPTGPIVGDNLMPGNVQETRALPEGMELTEEVPVAKGEAVKDGDVIPMKQFSLKVNGGTKVFNVADVDDESHIYASCINKKNTWLVISKKEFRIYVYEAVDADTLLRATFPVCLARNAQDKTRTGDSCTPESKNEKTPFTISQIQNSETWKHTFKNDPRGNILAYGPFFMRLRLTGSRVPGNSSIGIHGCGGYEGKSNSYSVPGRDSEGCIRLRDNDLKTLRNSYCEVGTRVFIKPATGVAGNRYGYETKAIEALGSTFVPATYGNPLSEKTKTL